MPSPLLLSVAIPIGAGLACLLIPSRARRLREGLAVLTTALAVGTAALVFISDLPAAGISWFSVQPGLSLDLDFQASAFARLTLLVVSVFGFLAALYSVPLLASHHRHQEYYAYFLLALGVTAGAVLSQNLLLLLFFWELHGLLLFLMAGLNGESAQRAAARTLLIAGLGDLCLLLGIGLIWLQSGTLSVGQLLESGAVTHAAATDAAFVLVMAGAFVKIGIMPLHSWITAISTETPMTVMAYFTSLDKMLGFYVVMLAGSGIFGLDGWRGWLLIGFGAVSLLGGVLMAMVQSDYRKMLAFHSVSQMGYALLGIGTGTPLGVAGGLFHVVNMVIVKGALYLCGGSVQRSTGRASFADLGGLARVMPWTFVSTLVASLAIAGVPPLNAFVSKWLIYQGIIQRGGPAFPVVLVVAMFGSALTMASFMKLLYSFFWGQRPDALKQAKESPWLMTVPLGILSLLAVIFGALYGWPLTKLIGPVVGQVIQPSGLWHAGVAALLLVLSLAVGAVAYYAGRRAPEQVDAFLGGEAPTQETYRVPGTHFYGPVKSFSWLKPAYAAAEHGNLDVFRIISDAVLRAAAWIYRYIDQALADFYQEIIPALWTLIGRIMQLLNAHMVLTRLLWVLYAASLLGVLVAQRNAQVLGAVRVIACVGMLGWAFLAWAEQRLSPMLVLAASSQFGFVVLAASLGWGVAASYLATGSVGLLILFLLVRYIRSRRKTDQIAAMTGLAGQMPLVFVLFVLASLWLAGLPPFGTFFSKFLLGVAAGEISPLLSVAITGTAILTLSYLLRPIRQFLHPA